VFLSPEDNIIDRRAVRIRRAILTNRFPIFEAAGGLPESLQATSAFTEA